jgi:hypothetical protein
MAFKVLETTAEPFVSLLYHNFLISGMSLDQSIYRARCALHKSQGRIGRFGHNVEILDYIIPVLHLCVEGLLQPESQTSSNAAVTRATSLPDDPAVLPLHDMEIIGRDAVVLELENLFEHSSTILLHG